MGMLFARELSMRFFLRVLFLFLIWQAITRLYLGIGGPSNAVALVVCALLAIGLTWLIGKTPVGRAIFYGPLHDDTPPPPPEDRGNSIWRD